MPTPLCLSGIRINGEEDNQVGRSIATYWEDAMFHDYPSFLNIFYSSLIFWSFSPSQSSLFGQFVVTVDFHAIWRWITESGTPCRKDFTFQQVLLVFPFHGSKPQLISIEQRHPLLITFFDFLSMHHRNGSSAFNSS